MEPPAPHNRRILLSLAFSQALNSAGLPIALIVASLTAVELAGGDSRWAGIPAFLILLGSSLATFAAGRVLERTGYRRVLMTVCAAGMFGTALAGFSTIREYFAPFLLSFLFMGVAVGVIQFARYAAAETSPPAERARAMGKVVLGSTVGAIAGPLLVGPFGRLAEAIGVPPLSGPWLAAFLFYVAALANTWFLLRPEPKELARQLVIELPSPQVSGGAPRTLAQLLREKRIALAIASLVTAQWAMVLVMAITPLHMHTHNHAVPVISFVITAHFAGMFGMSFLSGWLADKLGRMETIGLGGLGLAAACLLAPLSTRPAPLMLALFLLGFGWSLCFLGASGTLSEGLAPAERGRIQGFNEALAALASGLASLGSGLLFATFGFRNMTLIALGVSLLPCVFFLARAFPLPRMGEGVRG